MTSKLILFLLIALALLLLALSFLLPLRRHNKPLFGMCVIFVCLMVSGGYYFLGDYSGLTELWQRQTLAQLPRPAILIKRLQAHLENEPDSARGWFLLGSLYLDGKSYQSAAQALATAYRLQPHNPIYAVTMVQSHYLLHHGYLTMSDSIILKSVLKQHHSNIAALNMLAFNAYNHQHYAMALHYWQHLLGDFSSDSQAYQQVKQLMHQAKSKETK